MLYTLNMCSDVCQLFLNKTGKIIIRIFQMMWEYAEGTHGGDSQSPGKMGHKRGAG